jgi:hypothetical protein
MMTDYTVSTYTPLSIFEVSCISTYLTPLLLPLEKLTYPSLQSPQRARTCLSTLYYEVDATECETPFAPLNHRTMTAHNTMLTA